MFPSCFIEDRANWTLNNMITNLMTNSVLSSMRGVKTYFRSTCLPFLFNVFSCFRSIIHRGSCTQTNILCTRIKMIVRSLWNSVLYYVLPWSSPLFATLINNILSSIDLNLNCLLSPKSLIQNSFVSIRIRILKCRTNR